MAVFTSVLVLTGCKDDEVDEAITPVEEIDPPGAPPKTWQVDGWTGKADLKRVFYDDDVAIYYDGDMDTKVTWPFKFIGDVWRYVKVTYQCTPDQRLFATLHGKGGVGTASYYYSDAWDYRNTIICYSDTWDENQGWAKDLITHEMFHVVESVAFGAHSYSAGYGDYPNGIWGDSQFAPIFQYDIYKHLGMESNAKQWETSMKTSYSDKPTPGTYWSLGWFLPIYNNYGKTEVLSGFFRLVGEYFPADRKLNMGEFVHFFSSAAKTDLKSYAINTFGWTEAYEQELQHAREEFPIITY